MKKNFTIAFFVVGFCIFLYMLNNFGLGNILYYLQNSGLTIFYAIGVWFVAYLLNAYCYYEIVNDGNNKLSFIKSFNISIASFALNYITPFLSLGGEAYRTIAIKDEIESKAVSSTLLYNMLHILSHLFFWLSGAISLFFVFPMNTTLIMEGGIAIIVLSLAIYFMMSRHKNGIINPIYVFLSKIKFIKKYFVKHTDKIEKVLHLDEEISELYTMRRRSFYLGLIAEYASRLVASLEFYFILSALNINVNIFHAIFIHAISSLMLNIAFFIPMEMGAREASMYFVIGAVSGDANIGVFVAVINRIREFFWIFVGLIVMQVVKFSKNERSASKVEA